MSFREASRSAKERRQIHWPRVFAILGLSTLLVLVSFWGRHRASYYPEPTVRTRPPRPPQTFVWEDVTAPGLEPLGAVPTIFPPGYPVSSEGQQVPLRIADWVDELVPASPLGLDAEVYRFTWRRSFDPSVIVQVERLGSQRSLVYRAGGVGPGLMALLAEHDGRVPERVVLTRESGSRSLSEQEWQRLQELLETAGFWGLPGSLPPSWRCDGADWTLEASTATRQHRVYRWSPHSGGFRDICLYLLSLTGQDHEPIY